MKKIIFVILRTVEGKLFWQKFFQKLFFLSIRGLNYGNGGEFKESGELHAIEHIKKHLRMESNKIIFDVGANIGNYSKAISEIFSDDVVIHAFEPSVGTFVQLNETIQLSKNIIPLNFGFSDTEENVTLYKNKNLSGLSSVYQRRLDHFDIKMDQTETIRLRTIDNYCKEQTISRINFLKIDIEGNELRALKGARQMIDGGNIDFIQFEFGGCNIDSRTYFQDFFYLLTGKYRLFRIVKNGLIEINNYNESLEIFITINYLAVNKISFPNFPDVKS